MDLNNQIRSLFVTWCGENPEKITPLARSGSDRQYFRLQSAHFSALGVFNPDAKENLAFIEFSKLFLSKGIQVPKIYAEDISNNVYLIEDLGDMTLFKFINEQEKTEGKRFGDSVIALYKKVLDKLPDLQISAGKSIDYRLCYPRSDFDKQSMMWDLNYFKYYFLKLGGISFDEQALEDDFQRFSDYLLTARRDYFLYRDFQSRNIMVKDNDVYFIDYQGGRRGALQYDLASLLFDAKADMPNSVREELLDYYLIRVKKLTKIDEKEFREYFHAFVIIRILQALGAYGFRGFYEKRRISLHPLLLLSIT